MEDGDVRVYPGTPPVIGTFDFGVPVFVEIDLDIPADRWWISLDSVEVHSGSVSADYLQGVRLDLNDYASDLAAVDNFRLYGCSPIYVPDHYATIQAAIDNVCDGGTVIVRDGTYSGPGNMNLDFGGKAITVRSESANPQACIIDCGGVGRGFYFHSGEGPDSVVEGLTIHDGHNDAYGGGIRCFSSSPTITNCIFSSNTTSQYGGGIYCGIFSSPYLSDCLFTDNAATLKGGGFACRSESSPTLVRCTFTRNSAQHGGGVYCEGESTSPIRLINCTFHGNSATILGGGVYCSESAVTTLENTIVAFSTQGAGVRCAYGAIPDLDCCDIYGNTGGDWVGYIQDQLGEDGNVSLNPLFCGADNGDFTLRSDSPCAPEHSPADCGLIGAWEVGCDPPANDDCGNAQAVGDVQDLPFDTTYAIFDGNGTCMSGPNLWYRYTVSSIGSTFIRLKGDYDTKLAVYDGWSCDPLGAELCCDDGEGNSSVCQIDGVSFGDQFLIEVGGVGSAAGPGLLSICSGIPLPADWDDDFDIYDSGSGLHGQGAWEGWEGDDAGDADVTDEASQSPPNSVLVLGDVDIVHPFSDCTSGQWTFTAWQYVPGSLSGESYFILLNTYGAGIHNWSTQLRFTSDLGLVVSDWDDAHLPLITDEWIELRVEIDLDEDRQAVFYNGELLVEKSWTDGVSGGSKRAGPTGSAARARSTSALSICMRAVPAPFTTMACRSTVPANSRRRPPAPAACLTPRAWT